jgi:RsmE family RNA methyltransferase
VGEEKQKIVLVIGPEGGFIPFEINLLEKQGCVTVSFGNRILRVEQAVPAILAKLF